MPPRIYVLMPGDDPIHHPEKIQDEPRPTITGWLVKIGLVLALVVGALWIFFNSRPRPQQVVLVLTDTPSPSPFVSLIPDYTRTPTLSLSPTVLPTDTQTPTNTAAPTTTGTPTLTPEWWRCTGQTRPLTCETISDWPMYNATYAMSLYQTQVAPLTPSRTPTITPTPTRYPTKKPAARKSGGSGGNAAQPQSQPAKIPPTLYVTYWLPPVAATVVPTSPPPLPVYCVPGSTWVNWGVEGATPYVITLTPQPECVRGTPGLTETPTAAATVDQLTPQAMGQ
jgi:hypothetical protein